MEQISVRELSQDTFGILARVERGESFVITRDGALIARLIPIQGDEPDDPSRSA